MKDNIVLLIAEDDDGHFSLIKRNLRRSGVSNKIIRFINGKEVLSFFEELPGNTSMSNGSGYLLLLDLRLPRKSGLEVLASIKGDPNLKKLPVIVLTTTNDPLDICNCYKQGCNLYVIKPVDYEKLVEVLGSLASFLSVIEVPTL